MHRHAKRYHEFDAAAVQRVQRVLLEWYDSADRQQRVMPWRKSRPIEFAQWDEKEQSEWLAQRAYEVWVSEIMLQQTQVQTVVAYYSKWMALWPTVYDLATADPEAVTQAWAGLGYYSRARRLQEGAKLVAEKYDGKLPSSSATLEKVIPGVGPYTAGAISSIVFNQQAALVDGNVIRVLSRLRAISADSKAPATIDLHWKLAKQILDEKRPGDFNQALMDFGATVCTPAAPLCASCPLQSMCHAHSEQQMIEKNGPASSDAVNAVADIETCGLCPEPPSIEELRLLKKSAYVTLFPRKEKKKAVRSEHIAVAVIFCQGPPARFCFVQRPATGLLANMWELPCVILGEEDGSRGHEQLSEHLKASLAIVPSGILRRVDLGESSHVFSHLKHVYHVELVEISTDASTRVPASTRWLTEEAMRKEAISTGMLRIVQTLAIPRISHAKRQLSIADEVPSSTPTTSSRRPAKKAATGTKAIESYFVAK